MYDHEHRTPYAAKTFQYALIACHPLLQPLHTGRYCLLAGADSLPTSHYTNAKSLGMKHAT